MEFQDTWLEFLNAHVSNPISIHSDQFSFPFLFLPHNNPINNHYEQ